MDLYLFQQINSFAGKCLWLDAWGIYLADHFEHVLWFCLFLFLLKNFKKYWRMVIQGLGAAILARFGIVELIRFFWFRPRPFVENDVNLLLGHSNTGAFPSGHAAFYFALSTVIFLYLKKVYPASSRRLWCGAGIFFFLGSFLICLARVFCGIHWPLDILAGAAVGIFSGWLVILFSRRFFSAAK